MPFDSILFLSFIVGSLVIFAVVLAYASIVAPGKPVETKREALAHPANEEAKDIKRAA